MTNYVPQFRLVVCTNNLLDIKSNDDGTWRRIRLVEFILFTDNPVDMTLISHINSKDKDLNANFKNWAPVMLSMLVDIAFKEQGIVMTAILLCKPVINIVMTRMTQSICH